MAKPIVNQAQSSFAEAGESESIRLKIDNEFGALRTAIVSAGEALVSPSQSWRLTKRLSMKDAARIEWEDQYHPESGSWRTSTARRQLNTFFDALRKCGVDLLFADEVQDMYVALATRDMGFVIGSTFFISRRTDAFREHEITGMARLLPRIARVVRLDAGRIEGGDILVHRPFVFVGLGERTDREGFESLRRVISDDGFEAISIPLPIGSLHLDCHMSIISSDRALIHVDDLTSSSLDILSRCFEIIPLERAERQWLASNVLTISNGVVVSDTRSHRLNTILEGHGFSVIGLNNDNITKLWGSFRCCILPLHRST